MISFVPGGTRSVFALRPADESVGYSRSSLRDIEILFASFLHTSPEVVPERVIRQTARGALRRLAVNIRVIRRPLLHASVRVCPAGTPENSPAIYRWVNTTTNPASPAGVKENAGKRNRALPSLPGLVPFSHRDPPMNRWAILVRPSGTRHLMILPAKPTMNRRVIVFRHAGLGIWVHSKSRSTYSIPCFLRNTSISSRNVILR